MPQTRTRTHGKRQYRKPALSRRRRLTEVAEGVNIFVTGHEKV